MSREEQNLLKQVEPMLINCWNFNNEEKCYDAKLSLAYYPKEYDGNNPPRIRYTLFMESGREQTNFNCSKQYVDSTATDRSYETMAHSVSNIRSSIPF